MKRKAFLALCLVLALFAGALSTTMIDVSKADEDQFYGTRGERGEKGDKGDTGHRD